MEFVCYHDWDSLPQSANSLFAKGEKDSIFYSRLWFEDLASNSPKDDQIMSLACVVDADRVLAILPLVSRTAESWRSLSNVCTTHYTLLLAEHSQQEVLACMAEGLNRLSLQVLRLEPVAEDDRNIIRLQRAMESCGFSCYRRFGFYNWIHRLKGQSYKEYMAARPTRMKNTIARKRRKLEREHDYDIRLYTGDDVELGKADYDSVYKASWKAGELYHEFINSLVASLSAVGWLRLAVLNIEGQPVATQIWFVAHGKASIFRLAYDEAWKRYSPGSILTSYLMEYVIDIDKVEEIDFLNGNDAYKQDWMSVRRECWALICIKQNNAKSWRNVFTGSLKNRLKRGKGFTP
jgi:hypothetical protein